MIEPLGEVLITIGRVHGEGYPWHRTRDAFRVLVAEQLLRRTTRKAAERVYERLFATYPDTDALAAADPDELWVLCREVGLRNRVVGLIDQAAGLAAMGGPPRDRDSLMSLHGVGPYIADAVLLYAYGRQCFPLDSSVQRVLMRASEGVNIRGWQDPYRNDLLLEVVGELTFGMTVSELRSAHQGVLHIAWHACRASPLCSICDLRALCCYTHKRLD